MTTPVPTNLLTADEQKKRNDQYKALQDAYTRAIQQRRDMAAYAQRSKALAKGGPSQHIVDSSNKYAQAVANEKQARERYDAYKTSQLDPFTKEYTQFNTLSGQNQNASLDELLGKATAFDPGAATQRVSAQRDLDTLLASLSQASNQANDDYATARRQVEQQQPDAMRDLLNSFAARGMAYSSGYGTAVGNTQDQFANIYSSLDTTKAKALSDIAQQQAAGQTNYYNSIGDILFNSANNLAQNAGQLGLAQNADIPLLIELARRRLASTGTTPPPTGG